MKRILTLSLILALVIALAVPGVAYAKRGGVPANGKAKGNGAAVAPAPEDPDTPAADGVKEKKEKKEKDKVKGADVEDPDAVEGEDGTGEEAAPEKLTGIANALARLQRNLARKQAAFDAGLRANLPSGLQATILKFMGWLGMELPADGDDAAVGDGTEAADDASDDDADDVAEDADEGAGEVEQQ